MNNSRLSEKLIGHLVLIVGLVFCGLELLGLIYVSNLYLEVLKTTGLPNIGVWLVLIATFLTAYVIVMSLFGNFWYLPYAAMIISDTPMVKQLLQEHRELSYGETALAFFSVFILLGVVFLVTPGMIAWQRTVESLIQAIYLFTDDIMLCDYLCDSYLMN